MHEARGDFRRRRRLVGHAGVVGPLLVEELNPPFAIGDPDDLRDSVGHQAEPFLAFAQPFDQRVLIARDLILRLALAAEPHDLGHVLDAVDDGRDLPARPEHGRVDRTPPALLEPAACLRGTADGMMLHGHDVGAARGEYPLERSPEVPNARSVRIVGIVREHVEQSTVEDGLPLCHGRPKVGVIDRDDP